MAADNDSRLLLLLMVGLAAFFIALIYFEYSFKETPGFSEVYLAENGIKATVNKPFSVQFFIHSHETGAKQYCYRVSGEQTVEGSLELLPEEKKLVRENLYFSQARENQRVFIEVKPEGKDAFTLWFWVNVEWKCILLPAKRRALTFFQS